MQTKYLAAITVALMVIMAGIGGYAVANYLTAQPSTTAAPSATPTPKVVQTVTKTVVQPVIVPSKPVVIPAQPTKVSTYVDIPYIQYYNNNYTHTTLYFSTSLAVKGGTSMAGEPMEIYIDGHYMTTMTTDSYGYVSTSMLVPGLTLGSHTLQVYYPGDATHFNYEASANFNVVDSTV